MRTEVEAKFLNVNHDQLRKKLKELGAVCKRPVTVMRRQNFDYQDSQLEQKGGWIRVRDEGDKVTLAYKQLNDRTLHGTAEVNMVVNNFDIAVEFLLAIGMKRTSYQETKRESWQLGDIEIELDEWPWIKPFVEIEASTEKKLRQISKNLGLDWKKVLHGSVEIAYTAEYKMTEPEVNAISQLKFGPVPNWLEARRK